MNNTPRDESAIVLMLYKLCQDSYVSVFGNGIGDLTERDVSRLKTCHSILNTINEELVRRFPHTTTLPGS